MNTTIRQLSALLLALAMCFSLLSVKVWAAEPLEESSVNAQSSEDAAPEAADEESSTETPDYEDEPQEEKQSENVSQTEEAPDSEEAVPSEESTDEDDSEEQSASLETQSTGGHTQAEAVAWARNQVGSTYERYDGYQCVDLIRAYYAYLGQPKPTGNANEYLNDEKDHKPSGWSIHYGSSGIQPGDILVWTGGKNGHVAIVVEVGTNSCTVMQQNGDGNGINKTNGSKGNYGPWDFAKISGYIHPDFDGVIDSGTCGDNVSWTLNDQGTLIISGTGEMESYYNTFSQRPWNYCQEEIKKLIIQNGVTKIGDCAFYGFSSLNSITIPNSVKSIGISAFGDCSSMTTINIPNSVTSILDCAFYGCSSLTKIKIPENAGGAHGLFINCTSLTEVILPKTERSIDSAMFSGCRSLENFTISDSVEFIGEFAFEDCTSLKKINIPSGVTGIDEYAFMRCSSLSSVTIPASVTYIGEYALGYKTEKKIDLNFTIYGYAGTAAERYAKQNGIHFKTIKKSITKTVLSSAKWDKKRKVVTIQWKKNTTGKGYDVQYSTDKLFKKGVKTLKIKKNKTVKTTIKKPKKGTYYIRIRTVNGTKRSGWSVSKRVTVS